MIKKILTFVVTLVMFYYMLSTIEYIIGSFVLWEWDIGNTYYLYAFWETPTHEAKLFKTLFFMFSAIFGGAVSLVSADGKSEFVDSIIGRD